MRFLSILLYMCIGFPIFGQYYKSLMHDHRVNIYEVKKEADKHFAVVGKGKGTGYKPFMRWFKNAEQYYYPTGDRSRYNASLAINAHQDNLRKSNDGKDRSITNAWQDLGPYNANTISTHYAPGIGRVECVYVNPLDTNLIYMSSRSGGLWKTTNGGTTWACKTNSMPVAGVNTFAVNPLNANDILINIQTGSNETSHGIYRSLNGGDTWTLTNFNPTAINVGGYGTNERVLQITWHPTRNDTIFVASTEGIYRSLNNFSTITLSLAGSFNQVKVHPTSPNVIYASYDYYWDRNKFMKSTNAGTTWSNTATFATNDYNYPSLHTSKASPNVVFFSSEQGIWKSTDSGSSFTALPSNTINGWCFGVSDIDVNHLLYGNIDLHRSTNSGTTWTQVT